jgi:glyoxylase-like metal-dependent hydrolase (beta-lactamase superfamily II)
MRSSSSSGSERDPPVGSGQDSPRGAERDRGGDSERDRGGDSERDGAGLADEGWVPETAVELDLALGGERDFVVDPATEAERLAAFDVLRITAGNAGPLTLSGTNTWIVERDPAYVIDPGPALEEHLEAVLAAIEERGGLGGIALTHDHSDHAEACAALRAVHPAPLAAARGGDVDVALTDGARFGPLTAVPTPGHSMDHYALVSERVCFTGDAVLGEGSVFISPYPGALNAYLNGLVHLCTLDLEVLCPGHGPAIWEPVAKLQECIGHRYDREHRLLVAFSEGRRTVADLLDAAWWDVPAELRPAAAITLSAHLDKLEEEGSLPAEVERPSWDAAGWEALPWGELPHEDSSF